MSQRLNGGGVRLANARRRDDVLTQGETTMATLNTATDILFHLGRNAARNDEVEGMMRHTGTDTLSALIRKLRAIRSDVREDVIVGLWALRHTR